MIRFKSALVLAAIGSSLAVAEAPAQLYVSSTIVGTATIAGNSGDGGPASAAQLSTPLIIAFDPRGNYYIDDYGNHVIRKVDTSGNISTFAGTGALGYSGDGGPAIGATFSTIHGMVSDSKGNIYLSDTNNGVIRKVDTSGNVTTFAGNGIHVSGGDGGPAASASLVLPAGLAVDSSDNLYIADYGAGNVRKVSTSGVITRVAGRGYSIFGGYLGEGGPAVRALLTLPYAIAVDETGTLFISDIGNGNLYKVGSDGNIHTIASSIGCSGMAAAPSGVLYYADFSRNTINKLSPDGTITNIAGFGTKGYLGDGGPGSYTRYNGANSIALDKSGNVYVADFGNDVIRLLSPVPSSTLLVANGASNIALAANASGVSTTQLPVTPGEVVTLFGPNLGPASTVQNSPNTSGFVGTQLAGTTVTFGGIQAPIISTGPNQIIAIVPYAVPIAGRIQVVVQYNGATTSSTALNVTDTFPQIFTVTSSASNALVPQNYDGTPNSPALPDADANSLTFFVTGEGLTNPRGLDGQIVATPSAVPTNPVSVTIGGNTATVTSAAEAAGYPAGILQVTVTIPAAVTAQSASPLVIQIGNNISLATTIAVQ